MRQNENKRVDKDENGLEDRVVAIKRVTKVVKGGRNMRFSALVVVGDGNGHVGAGLGKAAEIPEAIRKGKEDAQKHMISVARTEYSSITHDNIGKFGGASVLLKRAPRKVPVLSPAARPVRSSSLQASRTSVQSPSAPTISRTLFLLH